MATRAELGAADRCASQFLTDEFQRGLARWNRERLAPGLPTDDWAARLDRDMRMTRLEGGFVEELRRSVRERAAEAPTDPDGFILSVRGEVPRELPLLTGLNPREDIEIRRTRVQKMLKLLNSAGDHRRNISEVDASRTDNLRAVYQIDGRQVTLILGSERFRERIDLFLRNWETGKDAVMPGDSLDLTYEDRIIVKKAPAGTR